MPHLIQNVNKQMSKLQVTQLPQTRKYSKRGMEKQAKNKQNTTVVKLKEYKTWSKAVLITPTLPDKTKLKTTTM